MVRWVGAAQSVLGVVLGIAWYFMPLFIGSSGNLYAQHLMLLGVSIYFLGKPYALVPLYLPMASVAFTVISGVPVIIRDTRFSRSYSLLLAMAGLTLAIAAIIWQLRLLAVKGYIMTPVPNGFFYMALPMTYTVGPPFYVLIAVAVLAVINLFLPAGARRTLIDELLEVAEVEGPVEAVARGLDRLKVPYVIRDGRLYVGDVEIVNNGVRLDADGIRLALAKGILAFSEVRIHEDE